MKIIDLRNILRKDIPIYYRRLYTAVAVLDMVNKQEEIALDFTIENMPTGHIEIGVFLQEDIDYPLVPLKKELKDFITTLDSSGKLPM
ncbi:MAG: hypothetical protein LBH43_09945 [Treponema sp.]|jgi:hypothetical protein|nr:hypothetical protein [Treponema sp.]